MTRSLPLLGPRIIFKLDLRPSFFQDAIPQSLIASEKKEEDEETLDDATDG